MAELSLSCPTTAGGGTPGDVSSVDVLRRVLVRTGGNFVQDTVLDVAVPGADWAILGDSVTWSGADEFTELTQVFRNGVIQLTAQSSSDNNDVYFVSASGNIAFEYTIKKNDILQFWKFNPVTSSG